MKTIVGVLTVIGLLCLAACSDARGASFKSRELRDLKRDMRLHRMNVDLNKIDWDSRTIGWMQAQAYPPKLKFLYFFEWLPLPLPLPLPMLLPLPTPVSVLSSLSLPPNRNSLPKGRPRRISRIDQNPPVPLAKKWQAARTPRRHKWLKQLRSRQSLTRTAQ